MILANAIHSINMLVDETPRSFVKKNNSYSHCPLKKRPVPVSVEPTEDAPKTDIKEEMIDVVDDIPEPENLSTKPEDLRRTAPKRSRSPSPAQSPVQCCSPVYVKRSPSPVTVKSQPPSPATSVISHHHPHMPTAQYSPQYHHPHQAMTPPATIAPIHPVAKKARVEVIQHNSPPSPPPMHFMAGAKSPLEPLNLNEPLAHYASPAAAWARAAAAAPLYPPHYLPYPTAYRYHQDLYPSYPVQAAYPHSSPEHQSVSPSPPHPSLTCPTTIQRPLARSYASHWTTTASPDHCGLSPTSSLGSSAIRSPPPATPEDLSSPGSDSGRSSAGSISVGSSIHKLDKSPMASSASSKSSSSSIRYQCPDCAKSYSTYSGLSKHREFHCAAAEGQTKKTFTCKTCEKVYMTLGALKMHIRTHTLPCKCNLCGKAFSRPWLLQGHIRTHTGEKPFSCQHCNRAFADRSNLRAHLQTHSDVKKYSCSSCSKTFSRMSLLTKHQEGGCPGVAVPIAYGC